jgi:cathepsin B
MNKLFLIFNLVAIAKSFAKPLINSNFVNYINFKQNFWTAHESPRFDGYSKDEIKSLCGTFIHEDLKLPEKTNLLTLEIPESFDSREQWPSCFTIGFARDQGNCGSCWAFASTEAFNDRLCISSNGAFQQFLSPQATVDCCNMLHCFSFGCNGGQPGMAWNYFKSTGIVTGGNYEDIGKGLDCLPYQVQSCAHHVDDPTHVSCDKTTSGSAQSCPTSCSEKSYGNSYVNDIHKLESAYSLSGVENIQADILAHGPVTAAFTVYEDFPTYKEGVYIYTTGSALGGHAVKIIGWGVEDGVPYWTVMNSWNNKWGDNGAFKIRRGTDECGIESMGVNGGTVASSQYQKYLRYN